MKMSLIGGLALTAGLAACSNEVAITADTSGTAAGTGGGTTLITGAGAASPYPGDNNGSTGTGAAGPGPGKVVTADSDMAQYQSIAVEITSPQPVLQGPFFVTDVLVDNPVILFTVVGGDCSAPQTKVLVAPTPNSQFHGMRLPILAGQSLCHSTTAGGTLTVLGFKPY